MTDRPPLTPEIFDAEFAQAATSEWVRRVAGADLPAGVESFSFVPARGLEEIAAILHGCRAERLLDLACGQGGPGLWLASRIGADLVGIDFSPVGIEQARARAASLDPPVRAEYRVADAANTGLGAASVAGLVCIDAIQLMDHRDAVMTEVARILKPGALAVFTTWEDDRLPSLGALFERAGLTTVAVEPRPEWTDRGRRILEAARADAPELPEDLALQSLATEAELVLPMLAHARRVIGTARA